MNCQIMVLHKRENETLVDSRTIACKTVYSAMSQLRNASRFRHYSPSLEMFNNCKESRVRMMKSVKIISEKRIALL